MPTPDPPAAAPLAGVRVLIAGPLRSMPRREAAALLRDHGVEVAARLDVSVGLVVVGDGTVDWRRLLPDRPEPPGVEVVDETELWRRLGLMDATGNERLYTPAMLAEVIGAPAAAIQRWLRRGYLKVSRAVGRLPLMGMGEVHVARSLATLLAEGCSHARIDRLVAELTAAAPHSERPLAELAVVTQDGKLFVRRGDDLADPHGQLLLDFDDARTSDEDGQPPAAIAFAPRLAAAGPPAEGGNEVAGAEAVPPADLARSAALDLYADNDLAGAIEACRAAAFASAEAADQTLLAQLLYQAGDIGAARERYFVALERDPDDVEARISLGCLLSEEGALDLAEAALRGVLSQQPDLADAHYHLARTLDQAGRRDEATGHWRRFLRLAPAGPWSEEAADRLADPINPPD